ncbi:formate dehydrogenase, cytochrome C subunit, gamma subunit [Cupriavidus taiwanensis]|uniref:formate dehydrogenase subunit gamma n=1 Tax=Cupriavidus taiwanensis TaxID=164546 RepID=UPI000E165974|nr:formate dehydrogenase subunit gamma [Cupriavidus taiwanensis]SPA38134.1 formate dehydrogenase, cytochrome C subunit, gamma subunit [Cupriavidus taiwanensis]
MTPSHNRCRAGGWRGWRGWLTAGALALAAAGNAVAQAPAPAPGPSTGPATASASADANNPATHPAQPLAGIASENIFNIPPRDIAAEARSQQQRSVTQPGNNAPMWREVNSDQRHYSSLPDKEAGVLIQRTGQSWRLFRNGVITVWGGWLLLIVPVAILGFFLWRGTIPLRTPRTGRMIERFTPLERIVHWTMAISFVVLAVSGIVMLLGKHFLLPLMGHMLFGWLSYILKNLHNVVGPIFTLSVIVAFVVFLRDNLPSRDDVRWVTSLGGLASGKHVPSGRFNAGEKMWFWVGVFVFGLVLSVSGWVLDMIVPGMDYYRATMQIANVIHGISAVLMIAMACGHIYMGTIGMEGAYRAMRDGWVDEAWAREHHELWYDDIKSGKIPAQRSASPDAAAARPARQSPGEA